MPNKIPNGTLNHLTGGLPNNEQEANWNSTEAAYCTASKGVALEPTAVECRYPAHENNAESNYMFNHEEIMITIQNDNLAATAPGW